MSEMMIVGGEDGSIDQALVGSPRPGASDVPSEREWAGTTSPSNFKEAHEEEVNALFDELDRNGDGVVNIRELIITLKKSSRLAHRLLLPSHVRQEDGSRDLVEDFFRSIDTDGDRQLTRTEFSSYFFNSTTCAVRAGCEGAGGEVVVIPKSPVRRQDTPPLTEPLALPSPIAIPATIPEGGEEDEEENEIEENIVEEVVVVEEEVVVKETAVESKIEEPRGSEQSQKETRLRGKESAASLSAIPTFASVDVDVDVDEGNGGLRGSRGVGIGIVEKGALRIALPATNGIEEYEEETRRRRRYEGSSANTIPERLVTPTVAQLEAMLDEALSTPGESSISTHLPVEMVEKMQENKDVKDEEELYEAFAGVSITHTKPRTTREEESRHRDDDHDHHRHEEASVVTAATAKGRVPAASVNSAPAAAAVQPEPAPPVQTVSPDAKATAATATATVTHRKQSKRGDSDRYDESVIERVYADYGADPLYARERALDAALGLITINPKLSIALEAAAWARRDESEQTTERVHRGQGGGAGGGGGGRDERRRRGATVERGGGGGLAGGGGVAGGVHVLGPKMKAASASAARSRSNRAATAPEKSTKNSAFDDASSDSRRRRRGLAAHVVDDLAKRLPGLCGGGRGGETEALRLIAAVVVATRRAGPPPQRR